ncbi:MAG: hypothetical protein IKT79_01530 [Akkermansia sp.]|nr:hypothetical protein [Akkermansia sp.]
MTNKEFQELLKTYPDDALVTLIFYAPYEGVDEMWTDLTEERIYLDAEGDLNIRAT